MSTRRKRHLAPKHRLDAERLENRFALTASVGDLVWNDLNSNGLQDDGEPGVPGAVVELRSGGSLSKTTVSDSAGRWQFDQLVPGASYQLRFRPPVGYAFTTQVPNAASRDSDADAQGFSASFVLANGVDDQTHDAGVVRVGEQFPVTLGPRTLLMNNYGLGGFFNFPDMNIEVLSRSPELQLLVAASDGPLFYSHVVQGTDIQHLNSYRTILGPGPTGSFDNGGAWSCGKYRSPDGSLYVFYYTEDRDGMPAADTGFGWYASLGVAVSHDDGYSFTKLGQIIRSDLPKDPNGPSAQGNGEASFIVDPTGRYLYAYYTNHANDSDAIQMYVARADLSQGPPVPGSWKKFYQGSFSEPGLGGHDTMVLRAPGGSGHAIFPSITYSSFLGLYVMTYAINDFPELDSGYPRDSGFYLSFSTDGLHWSSDRQILTAWTIPYWDKEIAVHPTIVWDDDTGSSGDGWLVYGYSPRWGYQTPSSPYSLYGQRISLGAAQTAPSPATSFAYEGFGHAPGDIAGQVSGNSVGFDGLWTPLFGAGSVAAANVAYAGLTGAGNHFEEGQNSRVRRRLDLSAAGMFSQFAEPRWVKEGGLWSNKPLVGRSGTVLYASFLQQASVTDGYYAFEFQRADYSPAEKDDNRVLFVGYNTAWYCAESTFNGSISKSLGVPTTTPNLIVVKFEFGNDNQDRASVYRNPSLAGEPAVPDAVLTGDFAFDRVTMANFSSVTNVLSCDELRFAGTYRSALGLAVNKAPTDITLSATSIAENSAIGTAVGTLSAADVDAGDTFTYSLVTGTGSGDNASFAVVGNAIKTAASFNYEVRNSYSIRIRVTDAGGLTTEKQFKISVTNVNEAPTNITLSGTTVAENSVVGVAVGTLSTTDIDAGDTFRYSLVTGAGAADNASFAIVGNTLKTAASFNYEVKNSYSIRIRPPTPAVSPPKSSSRSRLPTSTRLPPTSPAPPAMVRSR